VDVGSVLKWVEQRNVDDKREIQDEMKKEGSGKMEEFVEWKHMEISAKEGTGLEQWVNDVKGIVINKLN